MANRIEKLLAEKGIKLTGQRKIIAKVISESDDHPDVEELRRRAAAKDPNISIATVYRAVKLFEDLSLIGRHDFRDGRSRYEAIHEEHHDHLIDLASGKVIEFKNEQIEKIQEIIAKELGYKLVDHRLELYCVPLEEENN